MKFTDLLPEPHSELDPRIWQDQELRPEVRTNLMAIARDFYEFCDIEFPVIDVVITGSMANYNYTEHSDLDLHLITDYSRIQCDQELSELFDTKRLLYEREHKIHIRSIPVTLYVEDRAQPGVSSGVYSVKQDQWISEPQHRDFSLDEKTVKHWYTVWQTLIDHAVELNDLTTARNLLKLLRQYRRLGLQQPGAEFSTENTVYKLLRNSQSVARLSDLVNDLHDQNLSIKSQ